MGISKTSNAPQERREIDKHDAELELLKIRTELLRESLREKRERREEQDKTLSRQSPWNKFWRGLWEAWKYHSTGISTLMSTLAIIVGGVWTFSVYIDQRRQEEIVRRQSVIKDFAMDLNDPESRNNAAYSLAVLAGKEAVPLLVENLAEASQKKDTGTFQFALAESLIMIGEPALGPVLDLHCQSDVDCRPDLRIYDMQSTSAMTATQSVIVRFLKSSPSYFSDEARLDQIQLNDPNLRYDNLVGLDLTGLNVQNGDLCNANLRGSIMVRTKFKNSQLGLTDLRDVDLSESSLTNSGLGGTDLRGATLTDVDFDNAYMGCINASDADFSDSDFQRTNLERADLEKAQLLRVNFQYANLNMANLKEANLQGADLRRANFQGVDFSGADFEGARFYTKPEDNPHMESDWPFVNYTGVESGDGALVVNADFSGARITNEEIRVYLCKWHAKNVPGGCDDVKPRRDYGITGSGSSGCSICF
jgi:uncharacterized protein YjbI with pentapeptide repeats